MLFLNTNSAAIQAVSTVILVLVTMIYAYLTYRSVSEIKKQKDLSIIPILIPKSFHISMTKHQDNACIDCILENIGNGPAQQILVSFFDAETDNLISSSTHTIDIITNEEENVVHIHLPNEELEEVRYQKEEDSMVAGIKVVIYFQDFLNNVYTTTKHFMLDQKTLDMKPVMGSFDFVAE